MPLRKFPLVSGEYYHIFNRSINKEPIFTAQRDCQRALLTIDYYRYRNPPVRLSHSLSYGTDKREKIIDNIKRNPEKHQELVEIICFCLMPNHFHLLLKQTQDEGISKFLSLFQNSYTRYFNSKRHRDGHLFKGQFASVRIEGDEQLLHLQRYIHLNPFSSFVVRKITDLENYPFSSLSEYLGKKEGFCKKEIILDQFGGLEDFKKFLFDQADYQRQLQIIKHLALE